MGSLKHIVAGMALGAALVGFAVAFALHAPPPPGARQPIANPQPRPEIPEAKERPPAVEKGAGPETPADPPKIVPKAPPAPPVETRVGSRDVPFVLAADDTLDPDALAKVTTGQASTDEREAGLAHRMGASERVSDTTPHDLPAPAPPPLKPQNLDKLLPLFGVSAP